MRNTQSGRDGLDLTLSLLSSAPTGCRPAQYMGRLGEHSLLIAPEILFLLNLSMYSPFPNHFVQAVQVNTALPEG
jgi:hypothetical protein